MDYQREYWLYLIYFLTYKCLSACQSKDEMVYDSVHMPNEMLLFTSTVKEKMDIELMDLSNYI